MEVVESHVDFIKAEAASEADIAAIHTKAHIEHVKGQGLYPIAALAAGGAIQAATIGLKEPALGLIRPPRAPCLIKLFMGFLLFQ